MSYSPLAIANYFLEKAKSEGEALTPMKLQKLVYFAHCWYLAYYKEPLLNEKVQAWKFGPVIKSLYKEFRLFGNNAIDIKAKEKKWSNLRYSEIEPNIDPQDGRTTNLLNSVWNAYRKFTAIQLSNLTHMPDSPWAKTYIKGSRDDEIDDKLIEEHFTSKIKV